MTEPRSSRSARAVCTRGLSRSAASFGLAVVALALLMGGCAKAPYKDRKDDLATKLRTIREAGGLPEGRQLAAQSGTVTLEPPPAFGDQQLVTSNAAIIDAEDLAAIGKTDAPRGWFSMLGGWCIAEAASVLEKGEFLDGTEGRTRESSSRCADYVDRLRYLLVVRKRAGTGEHSSYERSFAGAATLVDLQSKSVIGTMPISESTRGELGATTYVQGQERRVITQAASDPQIAARAALATTFKKVVPRSSFPESWTGTL